MPAKETLILAVTKMIGGMCIAGMTTDPDPQTGLQWVRPIREHGHVLLGDISTPDGQVLKPFDVARLKLLAPHAEPPHSEDWVTDFVRTRPQVVRHLDGQRRADFLSKYRDPNPNQVLKSQQRSLCLIKPNWVQGEFHLDSYSGKLEARLAFRLAGRAYWGSRARGGFSVTDIKWRALGRSWLPDGGGWTELNSEDIESRLSIQEIYLVVGLTRTYEGCCWPIVVGVHTVPDYEAKVDYDNL